MRHFVRSKLATATAIALATGLGISTQVSADVLDAQATAKTGTPDTPPVLSVFTGGDLGDYLMFPYYNVRPGNVNVVTAADGTGGNFATSFTVTNTDPVNSVLVKVRIYEHTVCNDALDFMLFMSPEDEVVGRITVVNGKLAVDFGSDQTCRIPWNGGNPVVSATAALTDNDSEGMMEIIPMGAFPSRGGAAAGATGPLAGKLAEHNSTTHAQNCNSVSAFIQHGYPGVKPDTNNLNTAGALALAKRVDNVLRGGFSVQNTDGGYSAGGKALAIANTDDPIDLDGNGNIVDGAGVVEAGEQCGGPFLLGQNNLPLPTALMSQVEAADVSGGRLCNISSTGAQWFAPDLRFTRAALAAIDFGFNYDQVINNWTLDQGNHANIDWVVTHFTDKTDGRRTGAACQFALARSQGALGTSGIWDREENRLLNPLGGVSPSPVGTPMLDVCNCVSVVGFQNQAITGRDANMHGDNWILRDAGASVIELGTFPGSAGWADLEVNMRHIYNPPARAVTGFAYTVRAPSGPTTAIANAKPHDFRN